MPGRPVKYKNGTVAWHQDDGALHRTDGPAAIMPDGNIYWYINGINYSFDDWCDRLELDEKTRTFLRLKYV